MKLNTSIRKRFRVSNKVKKVASKDRFRLSISRSSKNISAQIIDDEKNIKHSIDELNINVKNIIENDKIHSNELINNINLELRALSKVIEKLNN